MQIAIADTDGRINLWCEVNSVNEDGSINFWVINGAWEGKYHDGQVYVEYTKALFPGMLVWTGIAGLKEHSDGKWSKYTDMNYNAAITWIQDEIGKPDYVMTQPDQYEAPIWRRVEEDDEWDDDIAF